MKSIESEKDWNSVPNVKSVKLAKPRSGVDGDLPDPPFHALGDRRQKIMELRRRTLGDQLHAPVRQVPYKAGYLESHGQAPGRFAKANPLDMAAVKGLSSFHIINCKAGYRS